MIFHDPMTSLNPVYRWFGEIADQVRAPRRFPKTQAHKRAIELRECVGIPRPRRARRDYPHQFSGRHAAARDDRMALSCNPTC